MDNKIIIGVTLAVIIAGAAFYRGMVYGKSTVPIRGQFGGGQFTGGQNGMRGAGARGGGFVAGEIIAKDMGSITIKMPDGSTKIALIATSTQVTKSSAGSLSDVVVGANVSVNGAANTDGSITAQGVQIRPAESVPDRNGR